MDVGIYGVSDGIRFQQLQSWSKVQLFQSRKNIRRFRRLNEFHDFQLEYAKFCKSITPLRTSEDHCLPVPRNPGQLVEVAFGSNLNATFHCGNSEFFVFKIPDLRRCTESYKISWKEEERSEFRSPEHSHSLTTQALTPSIQGLADMENNVSTTNSSSYFKPANGDNASVATSGETPAFKAIKLSFYAVIFLISVIGNTLVCVVIARRRRMRTVTNFFVLNLAASDLAITGICIPFDIPVQENHYRWPYGQFFCKVLYPLQTVAMFASIFTLTAVSLNRFWAIVYPLRKQMTKKHAMVVIVIIWIVCILLTAPYVMVLDLNTATMECREYWPGIGYRKTYTASLFALQYFLPLTVITLAYLKIGLELRACSSVKNALAVNAVLHNAHRNEARKVVRMLIVVTLLFAICVLPNNVMWLWLDFGNGNSYPHFWDMVAFTNIILFANSAANPLAYTICHENFREEFKLYVTCDPKIFQSMAETTITYTRTRIRSLTGNDKKSVQAVEYGEILVVDAKETVI